MVALHAKWGQVTTVLEPDPGGRVVRAAIGESQDQDFAPAGLNPRQLDFPRPRDWTVYALVTPTVIAGRDRAPIAELVVEYGSGAFALQRRQFVPPQGTALHVVGQFVRAWIEVSGDPVLPGGAQIVCQGQIAPGRPVLSRYVETKAAGVGPGNVDFLIPPFATGFAPREDNLGAGAFSSGSFLYNEFPVGVPLVRGIWSGGLGQWQDSLVIPASANIVRVGFADDISISIGWEIMS